MGEPLHVELTPEQIAAATDAGTLSQTGGEWAGPNS